MYVHTVSIRSKSDSNILRFYRNHPLTTLSRVRGIYQSTSGARPRFVCFARVAVRGFCCWLVALRFSVCVAGAAVAAATSPQIQGQCTVTTAR